MLYSNEIQEYRNPYDCNQGTCIVTFEITAKMNAPIYMYYEIENYYQNHRIYVKSRNPNQLAGNTYKADALSVCSPVTTVADLDMKDIGLDGSDPADPCGLIAKSFFRDSFSFTNGIQINEQHIAWESDLDGKYKNAQNWQEIQWQNVEDEHFIVWMRLAATNDFRKLWGSINQDLDVGKYNIQIKEKMDYSSFDGKKFLILSNANALGGKNTVLTYALFVSGGMASIWTMVFIFYPCISKSK